MAIDFAAQIEEALKEYNEQVNQTMQKILPEVAKEAAKQLRSTSPTDTGRYASGWRQTTTSTPLTIEAVVYNSKLPGFTQLLEKGHAKRGGGRVPPASEHIKPVEEWVKTETERRLEEALR